MSFVLDSSAIMAWVYPDETTDAIRSVIGRARTSRVWVPPLWYLEVGNVLQTGLRQGRISRTFRGKTLADLEEWDLLVDTETNRHVWKTSVQLADRYRLTLYDAVYLELALRQELPLATLDKALRAAAASEHVLLLGL